MQTNISLVSLKQLVDEYISASMLELAETRSHVIKEGLAARICGVEEFFKLLVGTHELETDQI